MPAPLRTAALAVLTVGILTMGYAVVKSLRGRSTSHAAHVTVGSKDFTESILLAEIVAQMLEAQGVDVERKFDLGGNLAHSAVVAGQIDLYPEYTGTAFTAILHHAPVTDPKAVYDQVQKEYSQQFNLWVSAPLGFDNTFAILVRGEDVRRLNLKTISEAAKYSPQWTAGFGHDFINRQDGYPGFSKTYGLTFRNVSDMALDLTYTALSSHKVDMIAGNSTDGRIAALDLVQLEDDKRYFPPYEAVFVIRRDTKDLAYSASDSDRAMRLLVAIMAQLRGAISTDEMRKLNYEVDGARRDPKVVVHEWLIKKAFIER
jgi:glycine betaine/choline ABC-type transport system substrate-binding protein